MSPGEVLCTFTCPYIILPVRPIKVSTPIRLIIQQRFTYFPLELLWCPPVIQSYDVYTNNSHIYHNVLSLNKSKYHFFVIDLFELFIYN